ncbi:zf-HC2 domain-containing protein [Streptosporangium soli]|nr:zf-HC2 domain-containing protein [Streptosporangium sp. KLBMP 9127]
MNPAIEHTDVAAYALGLLEEPDRRAFAAHLPGCPSCTAELAELSGMASVFAGVEPLDDDRGRPPEPPEPPEPPAALLDLLRRRKAADRRARRGTFVIGIAAAAALAAGGVAVGATMAGGGTAPPAGHSAHGPAEEFYLQGEPIAGQGAPGVSGGVVLEAKAWGTHAALELKGIRGPLECELIAVSRSGDRRVVTGWAVPDEGYGTTGSPGALYVHGGSALRPGEIDRFEVTTTTGSTLLTIDL